MGLIRWPDIEWLIKPPDPNPNQHTLAHPNLYFLSLLVLFSVYFMAFCLMDCDKDIFLVFYLFTNLNLYCTVAPCWNENEGPKHISLSQGAFADTYFGCFFINYDFMRKDFIL